jgi:hypothetical protein
MQRDLHFNDPGLSGRKVVSCRRSVGALAQATSPFLYVLGLGTCGEMQGCAGEVHDFRVSNMSLSQ